MHSQLASADAGLVEEKDVSCCYARSDKYWITDPAGVAWETFHSLGTVPFYRGAEKACGDATAACCATETAAKSEAACCG